MNAVTLSIPTEAIWIVCLIAAVTAGPMTLVFALRDPPGWPWALACAAATTAAAFAAIAVWPT